MGLLALDVDCIGFMSYIWYHFALIYIVVLNTYIKQVILHLILYHIMKIGLMLHLSHTAHSIS